MTTEHPILFSDPLVRAILAGTKTETRRLVTSRTGIVDGWRGGDRAWAGLDLTGAWVDPGPSPTGNAGPYLKVPRPAEDTVHRVYAPWAPGETLWVREAWRPVMYRWESRVEYRAEGPTLNVSRDDVATVRRLAFRGIPDLSAAAKARHSEAWHPSIHMPRWASRLLLRVEEVRVERLQNIDDAGAEAEGVTTLPEHVEGWTEPRTVFADLWDRINGKRPGASWADNPWVWVVRFSRVTP